MDDTIHLAFVDDQPIELIPRDLSKLGRTWERGRVEAGGCPNGLGMSEEGERGREGYLVLEEEVCIVEVW